ncbi:MAG TPA: mechanosensitive ion channel domain-containing protein, partial [Nitrospiraceae bacterium]|nr:mechanosensitive ion channel domain-containing protein [Nitrospiraceae bacterium]
LHRHERGVATMMDWFTTPDRTAILDGLKSLALLAVVLVLRSVLVRAISINQSLTFEARRRWAINVRNTVAVIFVIGLIFIWAHELNALAVSLVAVAVALVLATKELILCLSGAVLRVGANVYSLGDRIEIHGLRGNVLDQNWLATTLLEIGPGQMSQQYTGRAVVFPNSLLLSHPLINETYMKAYIVHVTTIPLTADDDWRKAEQVLLDAAKAECGPFLEEARRHMKQVEGENWLDAPSVEPRVTIQLPEPGRVNLLLRIPSPAQRTSRVEQAILRRFLSAFYTGKPDKNAAV